MYTRTDLLDICFSLGISAEEEKFYRFAQGYLLGLVQRGGNKTEFFDLIKFCRNNNNNSAILQKVGVSGKGQNGASRHLESWCKKILSNSELSELDLNELNMLMGYCSRQAKIKENGL